MRITFSPDDPVFSPSGAEADDEDSAAVVVELTEVIGPDPPANERADP